MSTPFFRHHQALLKRTAPGSSRGPREVWVHRRCRGLAVWAIAQGLCTSRCFRCKLRGSRDGKAESVPGDEAVESPWLIYSSPLPAFKRQIIKRHTDDRTNGSLSCEIRAHERVAPYSRAIYERFCVRRASRPLSWSAPFYRRENKQFGL